MLQSCWYFASYYRNGNRCPPAQFGGVQGYLFYVVQSILLTGGIVGYVPFERFAHPREVVISTRFQAEVEVVYEYAVSPLGGAHGGRVIPYEHHAEAGATRGDWDGVKLTLGICKRVMQVEVLLYRFYCPFGVHDSVAVHKIWPWPSGIGSGVG